MRLKLFLLGLMTIFLFPTVARGAGSLLSELESVDATSTGGAGVGAGTTAGAGSGAVVKAVKRSRFPCDGRVRVAYSLNFRARPWGTILNSYPNRQKVRVLGREGDWYKVQVSGKTGYMHSKYVVLGESEAPQGGEAPGEDPAREVGRIETQMERYIAGQDFTRLRSAIDYAIAYGRGLVSSQLKTRLQQAIDRARGILNGDGQQPGGPEEARPPLPRNSTRQQRLDYYSRDIVRGACSVGFPPSIVAAQLILESDVAKHMPRGSNNPFGIKCGGSPKCVSAGTSEVYDGRVVHITDSFRCFDSVAEAIQQHAGRLLGQVRGLSRSITDRVNVALRERSFNGIIHAIKAGGYATAPNYESMLKSLIKNYDLRSTLDSQCPAVADVR